MHSMKIRGFTLIELLITIVIIGILSAISVSVFNDYKQKASLAKGLAFAAQVDRKLSLKSLSLERNRILRISFSEGSGTSFTDPLNDISFTAIDPSKWSTDTPTGSGHSMFFGQPGSGTYGYTTASFDDSSIVANNEVTISSWIKRNSNNRPMFTTGSFNNYGLYITNTNLPSFYLLWNNSSLSLTGTEEIPINQWTHLMGSYDGSTMKLYVNGDLVAKKNASYNIPDTSLTYIGGSSAYSGPDTYLLDDSSIFPFAFDIESEF